MASALDAVLQLQSQEDNRRQQAVQMFQVLNQAKQQAQSNQFEQLKMAQQQNQFNQENKLKMLLTGAQIKNYESDALKNAQAMASQNQQNELINKALNGNGGADGSNWGVKSIKVGDVTLEKPEAPINNGVPITDINSIQDANLRPLLQGVLDYKIDPAKSTSIRSGERKKLVEMAAALDPSYDQTQFPARAQFRKNLTSGVLSRGVISANTIIGHLGSLQESFDELNKSRMSNDIPAINAIENAFLSGTGKSAATNAKLNADAVANEMETLFRGTGGSGSLTGVEEFKKNFSLNSSPEQQKGIIKKAIDLVASRVNAVDDMHNSVMGKPRDFSVLNDKSKKIIAGLGIDPSMVDPVGSAQQGSKQLDANTAKQLLAQAGGDKNKARELAKQQGYQL